MLTLLVFRTASLHVGQLVKDSAASRTTPGLYVTGGGLMAATVMLTSMLRCCQSFLELTCRMSYSLRLTFSIPVGVDLHRRTIHRIMC